MNKPILFIFIICAFYFSVSAQEYEYGKPEELKGLKKVFIDTKADIKSHDRIVKEIEEAKVGLEIVESLEEAEIILLFEGGKTEIVRGATTTPVYGTNNTITTVNRDKVSTGKGFVFIKGKSKDVPRVVMNFESTKDLAIEKKPASKFGATFIKTYKKANGLK